MVSGGNGSLAPRQGDEGTHGVGIVIIPSEP